MESGTSMNGYPGSGYKKKVSSVDNSITINFVSPFKERSLIKKFLTEASHIIKREKAYLLLFLFLMNVVTIHLVYQGVQSTASIALQAFIPLLWLNLFSLMTCFLSIWVNGRVANSGFTYGYMRCEVLAVFSSLMLTILISISTFKECVERLIIPEKVVVNELSYYAIVALGSTLLTIWSYSNPLLKYFINTSSSSFLQDQFVDICEFLGYQFPSLNLSMFRRINPFVLVSVVGFFTIECNYFVIELYNYQKCDALLAIVITVQIISTLIPLCLCSAHILLQTVPASIYNHLEKCLREALTIDGVLEFQNEKFWVLGIDRSQGIGRSILVGNLHVRVRRDANEQLVLRLIHKKLSSQCDILTVQVMKDDWKLHQNDTRILLPPLDSIPTSNLITPNFLNSYHSLPSTNKSTRDLSSFTFK